jgi:phosphorylcholine metabolism protein LicD
MTDYGTMENYKKIEYLILSITDLFNKNNIPYWVDFGTLLGIVRDGSIIPWDHDGDISVWDKEFKNIIKIDRDLFPNGIRYSSNKRKEIMRAQVHFEDVWIDIYGWDANGRNKDSSFEHFDGRLIVDSNHIGTPIEYNFKGNMVLVPQFYIKRLEQLYGKNWKVPIKETDYWTRGFYRST